MTAPRETASEHRTQGGRSAHHAPAGFPGQRVVRIAARTLHIVTMALVLGGMAYAVPATALEVPFVLAILSGMLLLGMELWKSPSCLHQGSGVAILLKLALLLLGQWFPAARIECYLAATIIASIGAHMPKAWRHWSLLHRRVIE